METKCPSLSPAIAAALCAASVTFVSGAMLVWPPMILGITPMNSGGTGGSPAGITRYLKQAGCSSAGRSPVDALLAAQRSCDGASNATPRYARDQFATNDIIASPSQTPCCRSAPMAVPPPSNCVILTLSSGASGEPASGSIPSFSATNGA